MPGPLQATPWEWGGQGASGDCGHSAEITGSPRLPPAPLSSSSSCPRPPRPLQGRRAQLWPQARLAVCPPGPQRAGSASGPSTEVRGRSRSSQMCGVQAPSPPPTPTGGLRAGRAPGTSGPHVPCGGSSHPTHLARRGTWPSRAAPGPTGHVHSLPRAHTSLSPGGPSRGWSAPWSVAQGGHGRRKGGGAEVPGLWRRQGVPGAGFPPCAPRAPPLLE